MCNVKLGRGLSGPKTFIFCTIPESKAYKFNVLKLSRYYLNGPKSQSHTVPRSNPLSVHDNFLLRRRVTLRNDKS